MAPSDLASFLAGETPPDNAAAADAAAAMPGAESASASAEGGPAPSGSGAKSDPASAKIILNERFEIDSAGPIPEFHHAGADAVAARRLDSGGAELFAYVARSGLPGRSDILPAMRAIDHLSVLNMVGHGVAYWPPDRVERQIVVYERPARRLIDSIDAEVTPMREDDVIRVLLKPMVAALDELRRLRIAHGAVSPLNIFVAGGEGRPLILGDCVTTPTGFNQPAAFETIGRAMAEPAGRGVATTADDLYALGVSMIMMMLGHLPGREGGDAALIAAKIESGSYRALLGDATLPQFITEPIRGLVLDDAHQRWTLDDMHAWLGGRRESPRRSEFVGRLKRPVPFLDREFTNVRTLAAAMAGDSAAADSVIEDGSLHHNLSRVIDDEELLIRFTEAQRTASVGRGGPLRERRVARVLMALDPQAPIRYRGHSVMPEGIGTALAQAMATGQGTQMLAEIIAAQLPMAWIGFQTRKDDGLVPLVRQFDQLSSMVVEGGLGYGIERCMYELDPSIPCAGSLTRGRYVLDAKAFLLAVESLAGRSDRPKEPIDRHAAAFLTSRHARLIQGPILVLSRDTTADQRCSALVEIYDVLQRRTSISKLPQLCRWLASLAEPVVAGFHSHSLRGRLKSDLDKIWKTGRVYDLTAFIGNDGLTERDKGGFRAATAAYGQATRSIAFRRRQLERSAVIAGAIGRQAAAIVASLLSVMMAIGVVVMTLF